MFRIFAALTMFVSIAACSLPVTDLDKAPVPLGEFKLGHNIVVTPKTKKVALGRELGKAELESVLKKAVAERFGRYDGDQIIHFGISVESYFLAPPGVPIVAAPKSAMIIRVNVFDKHKKLTDKAHQLVVVESIDQGPLVGSGYTKKASEQYKDLARSAAKQLETYLVKQMQEEGWFEAVPAAETVDETSE